MSFFRQYIAPFIIFAIFLFALILVSSRAFMPSDMMAPAPVGAMPSSNSEGLPPQVVLDLAVRE